jgi:hypothetical protein
MMELITMEPTVPAGITLRGDVKTYLRNVITGEISDIRKKKNMILDSFLQSGSYNFFQNNLGMPFVGGGQEASPCWYDNYTNNGFMYGVRIGTNNVAPARSDAGIKGTTLASTASSTLVGHSTYGDSPVYLTRKWTFGAGAGTGSVGEAVLYAKNYSDGYVGPEGARSQNVSRIAFDPVIEKTALHELTIEWTITATGGVWTGIIPGGGRNNEDITYKVTINNRQLHSWVAGFGTNNRPGGHFKNVFVASPDVSGVAIKTGNSNADSDLTNDLSSALKGTQLYAGTPSFLTVQPYTTGNYYRDIRIGFDVGHSNGDIGELLYGSSYYAGSSYTDYAFRVTFTPKLSKINTYQLYLTFRISLNPS